MATIERYNWAGLNWSARERWPFTSLPLRFCLPSTSCLHSYNPCFRTVVFIDPSTEALAWEYKVAVAELTRCLQFWFEQINNTQHIRVSKLIKMISKQYLWNTKKSQQQDRRSFWKPSSTCELLVDSNWMSNYARCVHAWEERKSRQGGLRIPRDHNTMRSGKLRIYTTFFTTVAIYVWTISWLYDDSLYVVSLSSFGIN